MLKIFNNSLKYQNYIKLIVKTIGVYRIIKSYYRRNIALNYYRSQFKYINEWCWKDTEDSNFYFNLTPINIDQLIQVIALVTGFNYNEVNNIIIEIQNDDDLKEHIRKGVTNSNYGKDIKVEFSRRLGWYAFVRLLKPKLVVETGVHHGVGSCVITKALMINATEGFKGKYIGTDIDPSAGKLLSDKYLKYGRIIYGDSIKSLQTINNKIDIFINDSDHSADYEYNEYQAIKDKLSNNSLVLGDNSHVTDKLSKFSNEENRQFVYFAEKPKNHWYPGAVIGISFKFNYKNK